MAKVFRKVVSSKVLFNKHLSLRTSGLISGVRRANSTSARDAWQYSPETKISVLGNGFKVASENSGLPICTVGLWIDAGSQYENDLNNGVAHFVEHMAFKGTGKRSASQFEEEVESLGARLDAYTSRELMAFYATCLPKDVEKVVELLADMTLNMKLDNGEIEKERKKILHQINEAEHNFRDVCYDNMHNAAYTGTPLGRPVLGPVENLEVLKKEDLVHYVEDNFKGSRMVLSAAGGVNHDHLAELANKHFGNVGNSYPREIPLITNHRFTGSDLRYRDDSMPFVYACIGVEGVGMQHPDNVPLMVAKTLIGSWDKTHGCGWNAPVRLIQRLGWGNEVECFESFNINHKLTGLWGIYLVCDHMETEDVIWNALCEWKHLSVNVTDGEVERAKNTLRTQLRQSLEKPQHIAEDIAKQVLWYGNRLTLEDLDNQISIVDAITIRNVADEHLYDRDPVVSVLGRTEAFTEYLRIRHKMSWWRL